MRITNELLIDGELTLNEWLEKNIPPEHLPHLQDIDAARYFVEHLPICYPSEAIIIPGGPAQTAWQNIGSFYRFINRPFDALQIYSALYDHMLVAQEKLNQWMHKAMPLVWMYECYKVMDYPATAKRYMMLTLCEDAIRDKGQISPAGGVYYRLVWQGLPESELRRYFKDIFDLSKSNPKESLYPEWILQEIDKRWMIENPSPQERMYYKTNLHYIKLLQSQLGKSEGKSLERLAEYILSCMSGCRTHRREITPSTDYDIVCSVEGFETDFRSELGRYFICECKDWTTPTDFSAYAKLCTVLQSINARFGILFSKKGITGEGKGIDAERQELKIFQNLKIVIVVIDEQDIEYIAKGGSFIEVLRDKYEMVRLDLTKSSFSY